MQHTFEGFQFGFHITVTSECKAAFAKNRSVIGMEGIARAILEKEVGKGRVLGPFSRWPVPYLWVSPLRIIPKKVLGEFKLIHHLSRPKGDSVNDTIPQEHCTVHHTSFDDARHKICACGIDVM